jgi:hypothetical protein
MAANTGERTLIPAIVPPGPALIQTVGAAASVGSKASTVLAAGVLQTLLADFAVRVTPKADILFSTIERLPYGVGPFRYEILLRTLRLNCLTSDYADLWSECFDEAFGEDSWAYEVDLSSRISLAASTQTWTPHIPLRRAVDRRQALIEVDAMVAISAGITVDELCTVYRTQFPVLYGYDTRSSFYDAKGRAVPTSVLATWRKKGQNTGLFSPGELCGVHPGSGQTYEYAIPFSILDREQELRAAYTEFRRRAATRL